MTQSTNGKSGQTRVFSSRFLTVQVKLAEFKSCNEFYPCHKGRAVQIHVMNAQIVHLFSLL